MKKAVLYIRKASVSQEGLEIMNEVNQLKERAKNLGYIPIDIYFDICNGLKPVSKRDLGRLLKDAAQGQFDAVIMSNITRISRKYTDIRSVTNELSRCKTELIVSNGRAKLA